MGKKHVILSMPCQYTMDGENFSFTYTLTRKAVKNINLRIGSDGTIKISAPLRTSLKQIDFFLEQKSAWISTRLGKPLKSISKRLDYGMPISLWGEEKSLVWHQGSPASTYSDQDSLHLYCQDTTDQKMLRKTLDAFLVNVFSAEAAHWLIHYVNIMQMPLPSLKIRRMESRWGSCRPQKNSITLNLNLVHAAPSCLQMVVVHELLHFRFGHHNAIFYDNLSQFCPDWSSVRQILKDLHV